MKHYLRLLSVFTILFMGCNIQEEIINPDDEECSERKVTFTFPLSRGVSTYTSVTANFSESLIGEGAVTIYMVNVTDMVERVFRGTDVSSKFSGSDISATIVIPGDAAGEKRFYFVANDLLVSDSLKLIKVGDNLSKLLALNTYKQTTHLTTTDGLLLCGSAKLDVSNLATGVQAPITLTRRVARFDIYNEEEESLTIIKEVLIYKASQSAFIFPDKQRSSYSETVRKVTLPPLAYENFIDIQGTKANNGETVSAFYLYPSDSVIIQIKTTFNGTDRLYDIPLPVGGIQANKCYKIKTTPVANQKFELMVDDWTDNEVTSEHDSNVKISSCSLSNSAGWTFDTLTFDAKDNGTDITLDVLSQSSLGVYTEFSGLPDGYNITVAKVDNPALTTSNTSYKQTLLITIPRYTIGDVLNAKIHIRPVMNSTKSLDIQVISSN